jgi:hypothetical protein
MLTRQAGTTAEMTAKHEQLSSQLSNTSGGKEDDRESEMSGTDDSQDVTKPPLKRREKKEEEARPQGQVASLEQRHTRRVEDKNGGRKD